MFVTFEALQNISDKTGSKCLVYTFVALFV